MHTLSPDASLADLAVAHPAASRIFRARGLDFCCHGGRSLVAACAARGLDPAEVLRAIETATAAPSGRPAAATLVRQPVAGIIEHILVTYHEPLRTELPALRVLARTVEETHRNHPRCPRGLAGLLGEVHEALLSHMDKEEQILFPMLKAGMGRMAAGPIHVMEAEHVEHGENLARLRSLAGEYNPPEDGCPTWRALYLRLDQLEQDLMEHISLENNVLFPRVLGVPS